MSGQNLFQRHALAKWQTWARIDARTLPRGQAHIESGEESVSSDSSGIHVAGLSVSYNGIPALHNVSFDVEKGHLCGLVGMNGAGKSTLFKVLMGVLRPSTGRIRFFGWKGEQARKRSLISYVPQREDIDWSFPLLVSDVVMMGRYGKQNSMRTPQHADFEAVSIALDRVEMSMYARRPLQQLSGGQRKRVFVARALAQEARVLLLDEPFAGVDKRSEHMIIRVLQELSDDGASVLVASHDLHSLPSLCDEGILLNRQVILHDRVDEVLRPEQLAKAFDLDPDNRRISEDLTR